MLTCYVKETAHEFSRRLREQIATEFPNDTIIGGLSGPADTLQEWPRVYGEALQAMQVGKRLHLGNQIVEFNSLGVYQLLCELEENPIVQQFTQQIIDPLAQYDEQHRGSLVQTISAYFDHHGNISQELALISRRQQFRTVRPICEYYHVTA